MLKSPLVRCKLGCKNLGDVPGAGGRVVIESQQHPGGKRIT